MRNKFTPPLPPKDLATLVNQPVNEASLMEECTCGDHDPCEALKRGDLCETAKAAIIINTDRIRDRITNTGYVPKGWRNYNLDFTERLN